MATNEVKVVKEDIDKVLRMIGWQVAAGVLFIVFGMEMAVSDIVLHALQPFESKRNLFASIGLEAVGLNGLSATVAILVGSLNLGFAAMRFAKALLMINEKA